MGGALAPVFGGLSPTPRMVALMIAGVPVTLLVASVAPALWVLAAGWIVVVAGLGVADVALAPRPTQATVRLQTPTTLGIGVDTPVVVEVELPRGPKSMRGTMRAGEVALTAGGRLRVEPPVAELTDHQGHLGARFTLRTLRRGEGLIERAWIRWTGPLGLVRLQRVEPIERSIPIIPDTALVRDTAARIFTRDAAFGMKVQRRRGEGTEFDSLVEFTTGMDRRAIDWKHSARHSNLHAKEFRTERNHDIVFAVDSGHLMSEPAPDASGKALTKIDRALGAALLMGFVSLKVGDRVGWFAFDEAPYLFTKPVSGVGAFAHLQAMTSRIDYSDGETNFVLGLSELSRRLRRRSLVVVFTDFVDTVSAELMVENVSRLIRRHLVVFVAFRDPQVDAVVSKRPDSARDVARAVVADRLATERDLVLARLARMGVQVLDADPDTLNMELVNRFLDIKRRELL